MSELSLLGAGARALDRERDFDFVTLTSPGMPLADDIQSIAYKRIYIGEADPDILHNGITTVDHA